MSDRSEAAFARPYSKDTLENGEVYAEHSEQQGLSKREYFAAKAMQGMLAYGDVSSNWPLHSIAKGAVEVADSLIKALSEGAKDER